MSLTLDLHAPLARGPYHGHPRESQQSHPDDRAGTDEQRQAEQYRGDQGVIEVKEAQIVAHPLRHEARDLLQIKRLLFPEAEEDGGGSEVLPVEHL